MIVQNPHNQSSSQTENTCSNITMIDVVNVKEEEGKDIIDPRGFKINSTIGKKDSVHTVQENANNDQIDCSPEALEKGNESFIIGSKDEMLHTKTETNNTDLENIHFENDTSSEVTEVLEHTLFFTNYMSNNTISDTLLQVDQVINSSSSSKELIVIEKQERIPSIFLF